MQFKINLPLIGKIGATISKGDQPRPDRGETTETSVNVADFYYQKVKTEQTRMAKYGDYRLMDEECVEISVALDLYADNATKERSFDGEPYEIKSDDAKVKNIAEELEDRTKIKDQIWETTRGIAKMGDEFDEVVVSGSGQIIKLKGLEPETVFAERDEYGVPKDKPYVQKRPDVQSIVADFEPWQILHWKNGGIKRMYGESILKPARKIYKQLQLMEDGMVIGRLSRSHMRYKFLVDTTGMDVDAEEEYLRRVKNSVKKKRLINPYTGRLDTQENPLSASEDIFLSTKKDSKADVTVLEGARNLGNIRDVEYFQNKLLTCLGPKAFFGVERDVKAKATLIEEDIQFARRVARLRKGLRVGLMQLYNYQLILSGVIPQKGIYDIHFAPISMVDEMRKWTMEKLKADVAKIYKVDVGILTDEYLLKNFVGVPEEEIAALLAGSTGPEAKPVAGPKGSLALRASGSVGVASPGGTAMIQKIQKEGEENGFHIWTYKLADLIETMRDIVSLELNV